LTSDGEAAQEIRSSDQNLRNLRVAIRMAQEVGKGLGRGEILLGSLPQRKEQSLSFKATPSVASDFQEFPKALNLVKKYDQTCCGSETFFLIEYHRIQRGGHSHGHAHRPSRVAD
jgi:hypothetical protein